MYYTFPKKETLQGFLVPVLWTHCSSQFQVFPAPTPPIQIVKSVMCWSKCQCRKKLHNYESFRLEWRSLYLLWIQKSRPAQCIARYFANRLFCSCIWKHGGKISTAVIVNRYRMDIMHWWKMTNTVNKVAFALMMARHWNGVCDKTGPLS